MKQFYLLTLILATFLESAAQPLPQTKSFNNLKDPKNCFLDQPDTRIFKIISVPSKFKVKFNGVVAPVQQETAELNLDSDEDISVYNLKLTSKIDIPLEIFDDKDVSLGKCTIKAYPKQNDPAPSIIDYLKQVVYPELDISYPANEIARTKDGVICIFLDKDLNLMPGTIMPDCNKQGQKYRVIVVFPKDSIKAISVTVDDDKTSLADFVISSGSEVKTIGESTDMLKKAFDYKSSKVSGVIKGTAKFEVEKTYDNKSKKEVTKTSKFSIVACEQPYHVSILGGFYYSTLNDPSNVVSGTNSDGVSTLFADNAKSQRALTVMAVFYPRPRARDYEHKDLTFMQKWGVTFGTKLSQDLFTDLLLGLNYEVSKGIGFTSGVHYGKHAVVKGYDDFIFGKTAYSKTFTNTELSQQTDFGWFMGVTVDFRVIAALRLSSKRETELNAER